MKINPLLSVVLWALPLGGCYATHPWPDEVAFASLRVTFKS
ncbi:MAG: hypothetical protein VX951_09980 [Planctomycetota bacterium]|nr:hypothetical protein [Planctomycetota bacterium]